MLTHIQFSTKQIPKKLYKGNSLSPARFSHPFAVNERCESALSSLQPSRSHGESETSGSLYSVWPFEWRSMGCDGNIHMMLGENYTEVADHIPSMGIQTDCQ